MAQEVQKQQLNIPVAISNWWDSLTELQQKNLANSLFNRFGEWIDTDKFNISENDKKMMYIYSNCL